MLSLFVVELSSFITTTTQSTVVVDFNRDQQVRWRWLASPASTTHPPPIYPSLQIRINFNITMLDVPCEFATVDVLDVLGTNQQNVTKNIEKWNLDQDAQRRMFQGYVEEVDEWVDCCASHAHSYTYSRNREQRDLLHDEHHPSLDQAHQNGENALPLTKVRPAPFPFTPPHPSHLSTHPLPFSVLQESFGPFVAENEYVFANFYAPWCVWCQRLGPTWEAFAETVESQQFNIKVGGGWMNEWVGGGIGCSPISSIPFHRW